MAKGRKFPELVADMPLREAGRSIVRRLIEDALSQAPGVLAGDVEAVHDMRVALRRLRTAADTFGGALPKSETKRILRASRRLRHRLGAVRDADVHLAVLRAALTGATLEESDGIAHAIDRLHSERRRNLTHLAIELSQTSPSDFGLSANAEPAQPLATGG